MHRQILAVLLDFGDTLADQDSEQRDASGFTYDVDLLPGARELLIALQARGYRVALVARRAHGRERYCAPATSSTR